MRFKHRVNAWAPIDLAMFQEDLLDFGRKPGIFSLVFTDFPLAPGIIPTYRDVECLAEQRDGIVLAVLWLQ